MKRQTKLSSEEQQHATETKAQQSSTVQFATVEEALRHDAGQTDVPPAVAERLAQSIRNLPPPERSWWKRILGR
ncbi:MAG TPA: hypothetical protein PKA41_12045 [Verrucomicrobiota bacterium]|nr:hypothetical protein [Verrucomicrobiota bacterium]